MSQVLAQINKTTLIIKNKNIINIEDYLDDLAESSQNNFSKDIDHNNDIENINLIFPGIGIQNFEFLNIMDAGCSKKQIALAYKTNELMQAIITAKVDSLQKLPSKILEKIKLLIENLKVDREKLYIKNRLYILDNDKLKMYVLQQHYDFPEQEYPSHKIMF